MCVVGVYCEETKYKRMRVDGVTTRVLTRRRGEGSAKAVSQPSRRAKAVPRPNRGEEKLSYSREEEAISQPREEEIQKG